VESPSTIGVAGIGSCAVVHRSRSGLPLQCQAARARQRELAAGLDLGLGGFVAFNLASALGLPPDLPGTEVASLEARQIWWLATVVLTRVGLAMLVFGAEGHLEGGRARPDGAPARAWCPAARSCRRLASRRARASVRHRFVGHKCRRLAGAGGLTALFFSNIARWIGGSPLPTEST
jgi:Probable cobalt transporter subunit (CbtA)